ncbi:hypothetical protein QQF64_023789 [Cirrhinus molitorella]|uniref:Uncharacterized protein n=1 Tax=Cirrhinus molitorella TaxID=172907 RepID=A0ABR3NK93_9TELE
MISVSMDGPSVNWKFFDMLHQEHPEAFGGAQLTVVGNCGLHTLHNAIKSGFSVWHLEKVLRALHTVFHNTPARRFLQFNQNICVSPTILWASMGGKPTSYRKGY